MDPFTPPCSPRKLHECPNAPKKIPKCYGCYLMIKYGYGGENQESHMEEDGCLNDKIMLTEEDLINS